MSMKRTWPILNLVSAEVSAGMTYLFRFADRGTGNFNFWQSAAKRGSAR
jgi:hypothetical protein